MELFVPYIYLYTFVILTFILIKAYMHSKYGNGKYINLANTVKAQALDNKWFILYAVIVGMFICTRKVTVGTDTQTYVAFYNDPLFYYAGDKTDPLFELIGRLLHSIYVNDQFFIFTLSLLYCLGLYFIINNTSKNKTYSIVLFLISGTSSITLFLYLSMMRQCTAMSFYFFSLFFLFVANVKKKQKYLLATLFYVAAILIHKSAAFALPFILFVYFKPLKKKTWTILILLTYVLSALNISYVNDILNFASSLFDLGHYEDYTNVTFGEIEYKGWFNMNLLPFMVLSFLLLWLAKKDELSNWIYQIFLWGTVMNNLFYNNLMWSRLVLYLTIFSIIAIPNILYNKKSSIQVCSFVPILGYYIYKTSSQLIAQVSFLATGNLVIPYHSWLFDPIFGW